MRNLLLKIEYDGTAYFGWQVQNHTGSFVKRKFKTIQETIEFALQKILREKVKLVGSGRTDAGVHASAQIANFKTVSSITPQRLQGALNALLPDDIAVVGVEEAADDFHSRYSARSKVYRYTIINRLYRPAIARDYAYFCPYRLNMSLMRSEARQLVGRHDFRAFRASGSKKISSLRTIKSLKISRAGERIIVDIEADGFLYNMARCIVGTLLDIGRGKLKAGSIKKALRLKERKLAGLTAPAKGLCLVAVKY